MPLEETFGHGDKNLFLAGREVVVERRLLDAELVGNIAERNCAVAAVHEKGLSDIENALS